MKSHLELCNIFIKIPHLFPYPLSVSPFLSSSLHDKNANHADLFFFSNLTSGFVCFHYHVLSHTHLLKVDVLQCLLLECFCFYVFILLFTDISKVMCTKPNFWLYPLVWISDSTLSKSPNHGLQESMFPANLPLAPLVLTTLIFVFFN